MDMQKTIPSPSRSLRRPFRSLSYLVGLALPLCGYQCVASGPGSGDAPALAPGSALSVAPPAAANVNDGAPAEASPSESPSLEVVGRYRYPAGDSQVLDARWASETSAYILRAVDGVQEVELRANATKPRFVIPGRSQVHELPPVLQFLAASSGRVVAGGGGGLVFRESVQEQGDFQLSVSRGSASGGVADLDLDGDRLAILGVPSRELWEKNRDSVIAWTGLLGSGSAGFKPLLTDERAAGSKTHRRKISQARLARSGAIRFSRAGDVFVFPGYEPVVKLISTSGKVKQSWDLAGLGVLGEMNGPDLPETGSNSRVEGQAWLERASRVVEDIVPLGKKSFGLVVRTMVDDRIQRELVRVDDDRVDRFLIPLVSEHRLDRVRADIDEENRLLFVVTDYGFRAREKAASGEILVAALP